MQQGLIKKVGIDTQVLPALLNDINPREVAKLVVIDYFTQTPSLSLSNVLNDQFCSVDIFTLSKGIIFSKTKNAELNNFIVTYFNLLIDDEVHNDELQLQEELFKRINEKRTARSAQLQDKLTGRVALTADEVAQITLHNRTTNTPIIIENKFIKNAPFKQISSQELNPQAVRNVHRMNLQNNTFAIYMEYILSKSSSPKELSDIIGLQNKLFEKGFHLIDIASVQNDPEVANFISLMNNIDTKSITLSDVSTFIEERIKDQTQKEQLINGIITNKNKHTEFAKSLVTYSREVKLERFITTDCHQFESGKSMVMLGSSRERTGYSHEPIGIVMDVTANLDNQGKIAQLLAKLHNHELAVDDVHPLLNYLQLLAHDTYSYDEKNQAGGRALRTPYGHVRFVEYQTQLNHLINENQNAPTLQALKLETQFQDIFTCNEALAQEERDSISFNRVAVLLLEQEFLSINEFKEAVCTAFAKKLTKPETKQHLQDYIEQRLPLLWSMKYQVELAQAYFAAPNEELFTELRKQIQQHAPMFQLPAPIIQEMEQGYTRIERETFDRLIAALRVKTDILIDKGYFSSENYESNYREVSEQASLLHKILEQAAQDYFDNPITYDSTIAFKARCKAAITQAKTEFGTHRGWDSLDPIIRGILGVIATLTVLPALIVACTAKRGYLHTFFGTQPTDSAQKLETLAIGLEISV